MSRGRHTSKQRLRGLAGWMRTVQCRLRAVQRRLRSGGVTDESAARIAVELDELIKLQEAAAKVREDRAGVETLDAAFYKSVGL